MAKRRRTKKVVVVKRKHVNRSAIAKNTVRVLIGGMGMPGGGGSTVVTGGGGGAFPVPFPVAAPAMPPPPPPAAWPPSTPSPPTTPPLAPRHISFAPPTNMSVARSDMTPQRPRGRASIFPSPVTARRQLHEAGTQAGAATSAAGVQAGPLTQAAGVQAGARMHAAGVQATASTRTHGTSPFRDTLMPPRTPPPSHAALPAPAPRTPSPMATTPPPSAPPALAAPVAANGAPSPLQRGGILTSPAMSSPPDLRAALMPGTPAPSHVPRVHIAGTQTSPATPGHAGALVMYQQPAPQAMPQVAPPRASTPPRAPTPRRVPTPKAPTPKAPTPPRTPKAPTPKPRSRANSAAMPDIDPASVPLPPSPQAQRGPTSKAAAVEKAAGGARRHYTAAIVKKWLLVVKKQAGHRPEVMRLRDRLDTRLTALRMKAEKRGEEVPQEALAEIGPQAHALFQEARGKAHKTATPMRVKMRVQLKNSKSAANRNAKFEANRGKAQQ